MYVWMSSWLTIGSIRRRRRVCRAGSGLFSRMRGEAREQVCDRCDAGESHRVDVNLRSIKVRRKVTGQRCVTLHSAGLERWRGPDLIAQHAYASASKVYAAAARTS